MKEQQIQSKILKYLKSIGAYTIKTVLSNRKGIPDIIACIDGRFYAFEVKVANGKVTPLQEYDLCNIRQANGIAAVVRSVDEVKEVIYKDIGVVKSLQTSCLDTDTPNNFLQNNFKRGRI